MELLVLAIRPYTASSNKSVTRMNVFLHYEVSGYCYIKPLDLLPCQSLSLSLPLYSQEGGKGERERGREGKESERVRCIVPPGWSNRQPCAAVQSPGQEYMCRSTLLSHRAWHTTTTHCGNLKQTERERERERDRVGVYVCTCVCECISVEILTSRI